MPEKEDWRDVESYEGIYQVSNMGRVRRISGGRGARPGHVLNPGRDNHGYLLVALYRNRQKTVHRIHCLVCHAFHGCPLSSKYEVNHKNGKKDDNKASNLEWVTRSENESHAYRILGRKRPRGFLPLGDANPFSKLTNDQVRQIRNLWATGDYTQVELSKLFEVSKPTICMIVNRKTWTHI